MKFEELLESYEPFINRCKRLKDKIDPKELKGYLQGVSSMFRILKNYCEDYKLEIRPVHDDENFKKSLDEVTPLEGVLEYRGYKIPVYDDDYGQQIIGYWEGHELSGGSYNFMGEYDIADQFDDLLIDIEFDL